MADPTTVKHVVGSASDDDSAFWSNNPRGIPLQALFGANKGSGEIGMRLKAHDVSGDGYLDKTEFRNAISNEIAAVKSTKQLKLIVLVLAALVVAICGVMTGLTYAVVEMSKETGIASNGVMTKKGTNEAVQVAHATSHSKLTSKLPDEAFEQMEKLEVISPTRRRTRRRTKRTWAQPIRETQTPPITTATTLPNNSHKQAMKTITVPTPLEGCTVRGGALEGCTVRDGVRLMACRRKAAFREGRRATALA